MTTKQTQGGALADNRHLPILTDRSRALEAQRFGRLTVIELVRRENGFQYWLCLCDCGNTKVIRGDSLLTGKTLSCKCLNNEIASSRATHGRGGTRLYSAWNAMKQRCHNPNSTEYHNYGGRGIIVCERWRDSFENFLADMGERPEGMSIDRIDNDGNYEPGNCRWATSAEQARNKRTNNLVTFQNRTLTVMDWARYFKIPRSTLYARVKKGLPVESLFQYE